MATEIRIEPRRSNQIRSVMEAKSEEWTNEFPRNREWRGGYEQQQQQKKSQQLIRSKKIKRKKEAHGIGLDKNGERRLDRYIIMLSSQQSPPLSLSLTLSLTVSVSAAASVLRVVLSLSTFSANQMELCGLGMEQKALMERTSPSSPSSCSLHYYIIII